MTDMPTSYETQTTTQTTSAGPSSAIGFYPDYIKTIPGILKVVEVVLSLITFICSIVYNWGPGGGWVQFVSISAFISVLLWLIFYLIGLYNRIPAWRGIVVLSLITFICACVGWWGGQGWVQFVAFSAFISVLVDLILHLLNLISRFPGPWLLIEFIYYCVFTGLFLIAAIVAAVNGARAAAIGAAAFFAFAATAVFAVDTFFQFRAWRTGQTEMSSGTTTTTTTTHSEKVEAQY